MSRESNLETTRKIIKAWEDYDLTQVSEFFTEDLELHSASQPLEDAGLESYLEYLKHWYDVYPDGLNLEAMTMIADGDLVGFELRQEPKGPRRDSLFGGKAPSSGKDLLFVYILFTFRDGKVANFRAYLDYSVITGEVSPMIGGHTDPRSFFFAQ